MILCICNNLSSVLYLESVVETLKNKVIETICNYAYMLEPPPDHYTIHFYR